MGSLLTTHRWTAWTATSVLFIGLYTLILRGFPVDEHVATNDHGGYLSVQLLDAHIRFAQTILPRIPTGAAAYWDHCRDSDLGIGPIFINEDRARALVDGAYARALSRERYDNPGVPDLDLGYRVVDGSGDRPCSGTSEFFSQGIHHLEEALAEHQASQSRRGVLALLAVFGALVALLRLSRIPVQLQVIDDDPGVDPASEKVHLMNRSLGIGGTAALVLFGGVWAYVSYCDAYEVEGRALLFWRAVAPVLGLGAAVLGGLSVQVYRTVRAFASADPELFARTVSERARTNRIEILAQGRAQHAEAMRFLEALESNAAPPSEVEAARARVASAEATMQVTAAEVPKRIAAFLEEIERRRRDLLSLRRNGANPQTAGNVASALRDLRAKLTTLVGLERQGKLLPMTNSPGAIEAVPSAFSPLSQWTVPVIMSLLVFLALLAWSGTRGVEHRNGTDDDGGPVVAAASAATTPSPSDPAPAPSSAAVIPPPTVPVSPPPPPTVQAIPMALPPAPALDGATGGERLSPTSVAASSFIRGAGRRHGPERAFDGDPVTAWNESEPGAGAGSWISATFARPVNVQQLRITTGWDTISPRSGDLFPQNSHLRRVRITFDGGRAIEREVGVAERILLVGGLRERVGTVRVEALDVWPGTRWADLCISDILIEGTPAPTSGGRPAGTRHHIRAATRTPAAARQW